MADGPSSHHGAAGCAFQQSAGRIAERIDVQLAEEDFNLETAVGRTRWVTPREGEKLSLHATFRGQNSGQLRFLGSMTTVSQETVVLMGDLLSDSYRLGNQAVRASEQDKGRNFVNYAIGEIMGTFSILPCCIALSCFSISVVPAWRVVGKAALSGALALLAVTGAQAAEPPSALGITFGMTPSQVAAKLGTAARFLGAGKGNIRYGQQSKVLADSDYLVVQNYEIANANLTAQQVQDGLRVFFSPDFKNEKVIGLTREQVFSDGFRPQPKLRAQDYVDKFGKPSFAGTHAGTQTMLWIYDTDGRLRAAAHPEAVRHCSGSFLESRSVLEVMRYPMPNLPSATVCGAATLRVSMMLDRQGAVLRVHFSMIDYQRIFQSLDALEARVQRTEAEEQQKQLERTKVNKPAI